MAGLSSISTQHTAPPSQLKAKVGDEFSALVLDGVRTSRALKRFLGLLIAERGGLLVIRLGCARILRTAPPALRKCTHPLERARVILCGRPFEQPPRRDIVPRSAGALR